MSVTLPLGFRVRLGPPLLATLAAAFFGSIDPVLPQAVFLGGNYDGATPDGWAPPDPNAAVGPNYIVELSNIQMTILTKDGTIVRNESLSGILGGSSGGDPHVVYNEIAQRFAIEDLGQNGTLNFAVSTTSDPTGSWTRQNIPVPGLWDGYGGNGIGYNAEAYVVRVNGTGNTFAVINANDSSLAYKLVTSPYRLGQPVPMPGAAPGTPLYFVNGNDDGLNGQGGTAGWLEVVSVANVLSPSPVFRDYQVQVNSWWTSVINTSWRNGRLAIAGTVVPSGSPTRQVTWYLLDTTGAAPALLQSGAITPDNGGNAVCPSIAVAPDGSLGLNYLGVLSSGSSNTTTYVTGRTPVDPANTMQPPVVVVTGPNSDGRLGDYSSCAVELNAAGVAQNSFWACNEYLNTASQWDWRTRVANFTPLPAAPLGLDATGGNGQVTLSWTPTLGALNYNVKVSTTSGGPYTVVGSPSSAAFTDTSVINGTLYYYVVSAVSASGESPDSEQVSVTPGATPPAAPSGLAASAGNNQVSLTWNASAGATSYNVKRATANGGPYYALLATVTSPNYTDTQASNFVTYYYVVSAADAAGESANSAQVSATPTGLPPAPANPRALCASYAQVVVSWLGVFGATGYNIKRSPTSGGPYTLLGSVSPAAGLNMSFSDATVTAGAAYYYVVSSVNDAGESANSTQAGVAVAPSPWLIWDIGTSTPGNFSYASGRYTVTGSGSDIWGTSDSFRLVAQPLTGDCDIRARVAALQNTDPWSKAGVMVRDDNTAGAAFAMALVTPGNGVNFQWRNTNSAACRGTQVTGIAAPVWVRVVRSGSTCTAYYSADGATWNQIGTPQTISMDSGGLGGLAVTAHHAGALCSAAFDNVSVTGTATPVSTPTGLAALVGNGQVSLSWNGSFAAALYHIKRATTSGGPYTTIANAGTTNWTDTTVASGTTYYYVVSAVNNTGESANSSQASAGTLPWPWLGADIGTSTVGAMNYGNGVFIVTGSGADIWNSADGFRYVWQPVSGNCDLRARVTSQQNSSGWAKAGVMFRNDSTAESMFAMVVITPANGVNFQWRNSTGGQCGYSQVTGPVVPLWVRLIRSGNTFTGYYSSDGATWTPVGGSQTIAMPSAGLAGLAVCAHNDGALSTASFANVSLTGTLTVPNAPAGLSAISTNGQVLLSWAGVSGASGYRVKRSLTNGGPYANIGNANTTTYSDLNVLNGSTYYYVVSATNSLGESLNSAQVGVTFTLPPIVLAGSINGSGQFSLTFPAVSGVSYLIEGSTNLVDWVPILTNTASGTVFTFTDTNTVAPARFYRARE